MNATGFSTYGVLNGDSLDVNTVGANSGEYTGTVTANAFVGNFTGDISGSMAVFTTKAYAENLHVTQNLTVSNNVAVSGAFQLSPSGITFSDGSTLLSATTGAVGSVSNTSDASITADSDGDGSGGSILFVLGSNNMATINNTQFEVGQAEISSDLILPNLLVRSNASDILVRHSNNTVGYKSISDFSLSDAGLLSISDNITADNINTFLYISAADTVSTSAITAKSRSFLENTSTTNMKSFLGVQDLDETLSQFAGLIISADDFIYGNGDDSLTTASITAAGRDLVSKTDVGAMKAYLNIAADGDEGLKTISDNITLANANNLFYVTGADTTGITPLTSTARDLLDDGSTTVMRATLGVGSSDSPEFAGVSANGTVKTNTLQIVNATNTLTFPVVDGSAGQVIQTDGSGALSWTSAQTADAELTAIGALGTTDGNIIVGDGSTWVAESADTARISLGVGSSDSPEFAGVSANGTVKTNTLQIVNATNTLTFPVVDGSAGQVIQTDGSGALSWVSSLTADAEGDFGIGTTTTGKKLEVVGEIVARQADNSTSMAGSMIADATGLGFSLNTIYDPARPANGWTQGITLTTQNKVLIATSTPPRKMVGNLSNSTAYFEVDLTPELYVPTEIRVGDTTRTGKISFGLQERIGFYDFYEVTKNEVFIKRLDLQTNAENWELEGVMQVHAQTKIYLTTGDNEPKNLFQYKNTGDISPGGVSINIQTLENGIYLNDGKARNGDQSNRNPFVYNEKQEQFDYAVNFIHNAPVNDTTDGVMQLSLRGNEVNADTQFIGFTTDKQDLLGSISGHFNDNLGYAQSGIKLESAGADYAEYLERANSKEDIKKGSIIGVYKGKISKDLKKAHRVMVVSSMPLVLGNWKGKGKEHLYEAVAFVGQVPVRVLGAVSAGDYIVPSGKNDGTGIAISKEKLKPEHLSQIVGQAWEGSSKADEKLVNVAITPLDNPSEILQSLEDSQTELKAENKVLRAELELLKSQIKEIQNSLK
ncbi:hypothetical protein DID80_02115 [Candidatus Marinamargulisbacteria bacterium SCGC AAA071-K20]|nr:hypothetical protein DID80_02115 [Candidatus Marinamargulisbacteria bacterium SCGC AAA071-K20]